MTTKSSSNKTLGTYDRLNHVDPASISWHNIEVYSKPQKQYCFFKSDQKEVKLIKGVSGVVKQGKTLAIMGSSGAGKTTLLNVLTARNLSRVDVSGVVKINGQVADVKMITELTAYVQQVDLFIPLLTVREHLVFQAMVRMDRNIPLNVRAARINQVMEELSLVKCAETRVGGVGVFKGISGGEMKRLSFAVEILTNPAIMFCDEPTSGLDAFMAKKLVQKIRQMALAGRTIICTIHQPSSDVFNLFDNLLLLSDGRVAYMGKLSETIAYFNELGYKCPNNYNPADFFVNELAIEPGREFESRIKVNMICDFYLQKYCPKEKFHLQSSFLNTPNVAPYKASSWQQWKALTWRSGIVANRQPMLMYIRLFQATFISVMLGLVYFKQEYNNFGVININTALFLLSTNMIYQNALAVINTFSAELPIFIREHSSGQYGVAPYFFGKNLAELPVFVAVPILFVTIYYFLVGLTLDSFENFLFTLTVALFLSTLGVAFGYFMSCICGDADLGLAISPLLLMFFQLFGGFLVNNHKIPQYFRWAKDVSFYRYAFDLLMYNQWRNVSSLDCVPANDLAIIEKTTRIDANSSSSSGAAVPDQDRTMCFKDGLQIMDFYAVTRSSIFPYFGVLLLYNIGLRFAGYFALWVRSLARG